MDSLSNKAWNPWNPLIKKQQSFSSRTQKVDIFWQWSSEYKKFQWFLFYEGSYFESFRTIFIRLANNLLIKLSNLPITNIKGRALQSWMKTLEDFSILMVVCEVLLCILLSGIGTSVVDENSYRLSYSHRSFRKFCLFLVRLLMLFDQMSLGKMFVSLKRRFLRK